MTNELPQHIDDSYENLNELMNAMTTQGQKDLNIYEDKMEKLHLTNMGCVIDLQNRKGKGFSVLVMDTDDPVIIRKRILKMAKGIYSNFPKEVA